VRRMRPRFDRLRRSCPSQLLCASVRVSDLTFRKVHLHDFSRSSCDGGATTFEGLTGLVESYVLRARKRSSERMAMALRSRQLARNASVSILKLGLRSGRSVAGVSKRVLTVEERAETE
jgi:hypothetical protein